METKPLNFGPAYASLAVLQFELARAEAEFLRSSNATLADPSQGAADVDPLVSPYDALRSLRGQVERASDALVLAALKAREI
ncbi:MAG: hypothetical protein QOF48_1737 [Verrucomicrobiota bacterium]